LGGWRLETIETIARLIQYIRRPPTNGWRCLLSSLTVSQGF